MWKLLEDITKEELSDLSRVKKARLYADEDIEEEIVEILSGRGVNIKSARQLGHAGKPDSFHAALAFKQKRFLLTKNVKHYLDDRKFPFHRTWGIIVLDVDPSSTADIITAIQRIFDLIGYGEVYEGMKLKLSSEEISTRFIDYTGKKALIRFKLINGEYYQWVDQNSTST